jgi:SAM-dependent methyltransferase
MRRFNPSGKYRLRCRQTMKQTENSIGDHSERFYGQHADRYAEVSHELIQSHYSGSSHLGLETDLDLIVRMKELASPGSRGLDAGCGAGARDVFDYWRDGYDIIGVDSVTENIDVAKKLHPEISGRISVADLRHSLEFPDHAFDFVLCNSVIQHIEPSVVMNVTVPELVRVLSPGGVLQLMFKTGCGVRTVYDRDFRANRKFQLYSVEEVLGVLEGLGMEIVPAGEEKLGGVISFLDTKPMNHCVLYSRKPS